MQSVQCTHHGSEAILQFLNLYIFLRIYQTLESAKTGWDRKGSIQLIHTVSSALVMAVFFLLNSVLCFQTSLLVRYFVSTHEQMHSCLQVQIVFYHATRHSLI